jgi:ABC-type nitrate/sulfonate/bicarbonate transport system substrate-binding protein
MTRPLAKFFVILLALFVVHASAQAADKVRVAFPSPAAQFIPLALAQSKGFLKMEGLDAELIQMAPPLAIAGLASGEIDYFTVIGPGIRAALQGLPIKTVACYVPAPPFVLLARSEFRSVQELKGKTIDIGSFGGTPETIARLTLKHFGLDPEKDVKFVARGGIPSRLAAMQQGLTAATLGSAPMDHLGMKMGFVVLAKVHELFSYPDSGLVTSVKKIKERPDEIKRVINAGIKANRYIRTDREGAIQFLMQRLKIDREIGAATYDSVSKAFNEDGNVPQDGLRLVIDEAKRIAKTSRDVSLSDVADLTILTEVQRELGIKGK